MQKKKLPIIPVNSLLNNDFSTTSSSDDDFSDKKLLLNSSLSPNGKANPKTIAARKFLKSGIEVFSDKDYFEALECFSEVSKSFVTSEGIN